MKAVIVELRGTYAAALSDDGCIRQLKNKGYTMGQVVELKAVGTRQPAIRIASVAAVIVAIAIPSYAYYTPYSYVSLDIVPSIEYSLNRFDRVLNCTAVNGEGAEILKNLTLKNKDINEAIRLTVNAIAEEGYLTVAESGDIVIAASSKSKERSDRLAETLANTAEASALEEALTVEVAAEGVGQNRVQDAKVLGITPGKLNLIEKLRQSAEPGEQVEVSDWIDKSVKEIIRQTKEYQESENSKNNNKNKNLNQNKNQEQSDQKQNNNESGSNSNSKSKNN